MAKPSNKDLLLKFYKMSQGEDVIEGFKSERTAKMYYNYMVDFINTVHFRLINPAYYKDRVAEFKEDMEERFGLPQEELLKMADTIGPMINKRRLADCVSVKDSQMYGAKSERYRVPHYTMAFGKRGDGGEIVTQYGKYTAQCVEETHTSKRATKQVWSDTIKQIMEYYGVFYDLALPSYVKLYCNRPTEWMMEQNLGKLTDILKNGDPNMKPCTDKQALWIARKMNCSEQAARSLNKFQASELLGELFKDDWHDDEQLLAFYKQKLGLNESENRPKTLRLTEQQFYNILTKTISKLLEDA